MTGRTLIIPCGGRAVRMRGYFFPKCLLPYKQLPILFQIMNYWSEFVDDVIIVINRNNGDLIRQYINTYYTGPLNFSFCLQEKNSGTYFAIKNAIKQSSSSRFILNWSDVVMTSSIDKSLLSNSKNAVFTTNNVACRWGFIDSDFVHHGKSQTMEGGIYGVVILNSADQCFINDEPETDFEVELFERVNKFLYFAHDNEHFVDIGDMEKYVKEHRVSNYQRCFGSSNEIIIKDNKVIKKTSDPKLAYYESLWYQEANLDFIPRQLSSNPLVIERIKGSISLSDYIERYPDKIKEITPRIFNLIEKIHLSRKPVDASYEDIYDQYIGKTLKRIERIEFIFGQHNKKYTINGKEYSNPKDILRSNHPSLKAIYTDKFMFIHGDIQTSNILIDSQEKLYVIDPRGYFGDSSLFGDPLYDYAKLFYGLCGMWDSFRKGLSNVRYSDGLFILEPLLPPEEYENRRSLFFEHASKVDYLHITEQKIDILHAIIWLSVADYIANDVLSALYGYLNGVMLINELMDP
jgi:thiamine kinase-like enzyme/GTP:adenosylcobinamide-phosphate guanylyltransferase